MPTLRTRYVNTASTAGGDGTTNATTGPNRAYPSHEACRVAEDGRFDQTEYLANPVYGTSVEAPA